MTIGKTRFLCLVGVVVVCECELCVGDGSDEYVYRTPIPKHTIR